MSRCGTFPLFYEEHFDDLKEQRLAQMRQKVLDETPNYLLNVNETEYLQHLVSQFEFHPLVIDFDAMHVSTKEVFVRADQFPGRGFISDVEPGRSYPKQAVSYHLPFSGEERLLRCRPNPTHMTFEQASLEGRVVTFYVVDFYGTADKVKERADEALSVIRTQYGHLCKNVEAYNATLPREAQNAFTARREEWMKLHSLVAALGLPVKRASNIPDTFAIPTIRKKVAVRPQASASPFAPEPTLEQSVYADILQVIHDTGKVFERLPSTYADKDEEALRDHLILLLEPRFEGSTTGETFNKTGKTDILIRHERKNAFVGECKFWGGEKGHHRTIDQILSYLTWRDSKAAIIYFVRNKEIAPVLQVIERSTPDHPCFIAAKGHVEEGWFSYEFHLPDDPGRGVKLAVLCFHIPTCA